MKKSFTRYTPLSQWESPSLSACNPTPCLLGSAVVLPLQSTLHDSSYCACLRVSHWRTGKVVSTVLGPRLLSVRVCRFLMHRGLSQACTHSRLTPHNKIRKSHSSMTNKSRLLVLLLHFSVMLSVMQNFAKSVSGSVSATILSQAPDCAKSCPTLSAVVQVCSVSDSGTH